MRHNGIGHVWVKLAIKCLATAVLLWAAFRTVDVGAVAALLARLSPIWAGAALLLTALIILSDAVLLARVMRMFGRRVTAATALLYSLVGWFFSNLAPSTVGGDIFRGIQLSRVGTPVGAAVRVVLSIRLLSLATLIVVMSLGLPIAFGLVEHRRDSLLLAGTVLIASAVLAAIYLFARLRPRIPVLRRGPLFQKLDTVSTDFRGLFVPNAHVAGAWISAAAQHLLRVGVLAALAAGLGLDIPIGTLFALTPAALLVAMVPISFGGWGVRELTFVYFLGIAGVSAEAALSLSVAFGLLRIFVGAIGGAAWALMNDDHFRVDAPSA